MLLPQCPICHAVFLDCWVPFDQPLELKLDGAPMVTSRLCDTCYASQMARIAERHRARQRARPVAQAA